ncbi:DUF4173 domain-containing protein, partial [Caulobacter sp. 17J65-9]|uniref:DUF4153 domain-containing protein n=1 Tax=Caulobacter sp. 17J65-9 TaxID=2709382 RepID=UPI0013CCBAB4
PLGDLGRLRRIERVSGRRGPRPGALLGVLALPLIGGAVFLALFAAANPIIAEVLGRVRLPSPDLLRWTFWAAAAVAVWATLRPRSKRTLLPLPGGGAPGPLPGVTVASVALSLALFNALFAVQNGLDLAFLWSGAGLPQGVTLAEYAHRGAYPLIATALLAGLFVLVALRPGSDTAANPLCRRLVVLWVVQNMFLVASSILRTLDYVEAYSLTRLRLAALVWMVLVAVGLGLICWRLLRGKSGAWLINANALTAALALASVTVVDLGAVAAQWNVRNAREAGGRGTQLDLCYLNQLDGAALTALAQLEARSGEPGFKARVTAVRGAVQRRVEARQADWREWTWRDARRLAAARALV